MVLGNSWGLTLPGMNMKERIISSPIYVSSSELAILSVIQPKDNSSIEIFYDAFPLEVRKLQYLYIKISLILNSM